MRKPLTSQGFTLLVTCLVILVVVISAGVGYFVYRQTHQKTYQYAGYTFPKLPHSFTATSKTTSTPYPSVGYTNPSPSSQIETMLKAVCKANKYATEGAVTSSYATQTVQATTSVGVPSAPVLAKAKDNKFSPVAYEMSCTTKDNQWEFSISASTNKAGAHNVSILSMPVLQDSNTTRTQRP